MGAVSVQHADAGLGVLAKALVGSGQLLQRGLLHRRRPRLKTKTVGMRALPRAAQSRGPPSPASGSRLTSSSLRSAGTCASACPTATSRNCSPSGASKSTTSASTGGWCGSRRCWPRLPDPAATWWEIAGRSTRPTSRSPGSGATSTGRSSGSGRSSTGSSPRGATRRRPTGSSSGRSARPRSRRSRSPPIGRRCTRRCWRSCSKRPGIAPTGTPTTGSSATTVG